MSQYLQGADLAAFGVPNATTAQIEQASALIDAYTNRPEGLTYTGQVMDGSGAAIVQTMAVPKRPAVPIQLSRPNVAQVLSVQQSYAGIPSWQPITQFSYVDGVGLWQEDACFPSRIQITYLAGWPYASLPAGIKQACANIINAIANFPELNGNIQSLKTGAGSVTRFKDTVLDTDTKRILAPYCRPFA